MLVLALAACGTLQSRHLGYPLIWQDEGETVMFAERVLEFGYPKVHDGRNVVYGMGVPLAHAVSEEDDAYIGSLWGQYYFAALGVLLARGADDLHTKTALLRLPFALAGAAGLALLFAAVAPAFASRRERLLAAAGYAGLVCISTSLILHLREVRYYALLVLLLGCVVALQLRGSPSLRPLADARRSPWLLASLQALALIALLNVFYPAAVAAALWLALEGLLVARRTPGPLRARLRSTWPLAFALGLLVVVAAPIALYFELASLSSVFSARWDFGVSGYLRNLGLLLHYLLRYELLAPVLLLALWRVLLSRDGSKRGAHEALPPGATPARVCAALARLGLIYAVIGAGNPIFFERYFIPLSPLLSLCLLLESAALSRLLPPQRLGAVLTATLLAMVLVKRVELRGHLEELAQPYRGPLDLAIPALRELRPDSASLRIATNYEAEVYMYYLGSQVVGRFHAATPEANALEAAVEVDVVIPRKRQPKTLALVLRYLAQGSFERHELPVVDLPYNNIPELFPGRVLETTHLFRSQRPRSGAEALALHLRLRQ